MDRDDVIELLREAVERDMDGIYLHRNKIKALLSRLQPSGDGEPTGAENAQVQPSYSAGYAKAIEDAAKVAQSVDSWGLRGDALKAVIRQRTFIAKAIRALAGKDEA